MADETQEGTTPLVLTDNEKAIADNVVTILGFAKSKLPAGKGTVLVDYIASEIGKLTADTEVTAGQAVDAAFDIAVEVSTEAGAPKVAKLFTDAKKAADDGEAGKFFVEIPDGLAIIADLRALKK